jgi:hypothetical protein
MGALAANLSVFGSAGFALTAGDWDCNSVVVFSGVTSVTATSWISGINTLPGNLPSTNAYTQTRIPSGVVGVGNIQGASPVVRENISATTNLYASAEAIFSAGSQNLTGWLRCRRQR